MTDKLRKLEMLVARLRTRPVRLDQDVEDGEGETTSRVENFASDDPSPLDNAAQSEMRQLCVDLLKNLTQKQRKVLSLRYGKELTTAETSRVLRCSAATVCNLEKSALSLMLLRLRYVHNI